MTEILQISCHNTNQTHPVLVCVLLSRPRKGLFAQGSDYEVPLTHYPKEVSHSVPLSVVVVYFSLHVSSLMQNKNVRAGHTDLTQGCGYVLN